VASFQRASKALDEKAGCVATWLAQERPGSVAMIQCLVRHGAALNLQNAEGVTALMLAAESGQTDLARALLRLKADVTLKDLKGLTAQDRALKYRLGIPKAKVQEVQEVLKEFAQKGESKATVLRAVNMEATAQLITACIPQGRRRHGYQVDEAPSAVRWGSMGTTEVFHRVACQPSGRT